MKKNKEIDSHLKMVLSIQSPSLEVAWMEGYVYGQNDFKDSANPYHNGSTIYQYWNEGWEAGFYGEEALYPEYSVELEPVSESIAENVTALNPQKLHKWLYAASAVAATVAVWSATIIDLAA